MSYNIQTVIDIAKAEVGYLEKKSNAQLDSKTANAGNKNFTKYWAELAPGMNGQYWCNTFVNWCFVHAYGTENAKKLLCTDGGWSYYTPTSAGYFKNKKQWITSNPQAGDVIFFKNSTRICHIGIVSKVENGKVYAIEGNTSGGSTVVANGGGVAEKSYSLSYSKIAGYGRPAYGEQAVTTPAPAENNYTKTQFIKDIQKALGVTVDGVAGPKTLAATVTISKSKNNKHAAVKPIQKYFNSLGYNCGTADGEAGTKFDTALKAYQSQWMSKPDGEATAKGKTWSKLLGLS